MSLNLRYTEKDKGSNDELDPQRKRNAEGNARGSKDDLGVGQASAAALDMEKENKLASLPPAKICLPKGVRIVGMAAGLHHTLLLSKCGVVYAFGSNSYGQLGTGDLVPRGAPTPVTLPVKAVHVAAGSYHSAVLAATGEVYTFGNMAKGQLGRGQPTSAATADESMVSR